MKIFRTIDWICQLFIIGVSLVATLVERDIFLLGELALGAWQLISALINTYFMYRSIYRKHIIIYWALALASLAMLFSGNDVLMRVSLIGSWGIAIYYAAIYRYFMNHLAYRAELSTVIRH
jgi:hypothetical protein